MKILGVGNTESEKLESGGIQAKTEYRFDLNCVMQAIPYRQGFSNKQI